MGFIWIALVLVAMLNMQATTSLGIGVCYGMLGDNLPAAADVIDLYKKNGIEKMRLFDPNAAALNALKGSGISVVLGVRNEDLQAIAASQDAANAWFNTHVAPYVGAFDIPVISAGNEVIPGQYAQYVRPAMDNLQNVVKTNLPTTHVSTVVATGVLGESYPPSAGEFSDEAKTDMTNVVSFLAQHGSPLLVNVYPYFAVAADPQQVRLDYALFTATGTVVQDGNLGYSNLFDAIVDSMFWAAEKAGSPVDVVVSESGWPSAGNGNLTTVELATTYNKNFMQHILAKKGTPKNPGANIDGYIFAMFNENQKPAGVEQNFGLFNPDMSVVEPIFAN
ncbi:probable glucan endo-1,3-beta-glucosidase BG5 [Malania oleifera]|uniref:probable glucan endo-1,3-beta-glucosidase BG5 n=1 Tax=Malania oleifera TaxID=397392 RepID=UPI0025AE9B49|nr:probable glucan endo-1,3-beta-glucosidase BG5 [Malania oleifera]